MTMELIVDLANVIAAIGVIASLIFVGVEVRRNTSQAKLQNWASLIDRFIAIYSEAGNLELAAVIAKGRSDYEALTDAERVAYGNHLYQIVVGLEAFLNFSRNEVHGREEMERQFDVNIRYHIGCPGGLSWYREYQATRPFPEVLSERINRVLNISP
jgi:hypothetical protein